MAKEANIPKNNISKAMAIDLHTDKKLEECTYEVYGKHGIKILIQYITDNKKRVLHELKLMLYKNNYNLADANSIAFEFKYIELVTIFKDDNKNLENLVIDISYDFNINDICENITKYTLICKSNNIWDIIQILKDKKIEYSYFIGMKSINILKLSKAQLEDCIEIIDKFKNLEDVHKVWSNLPIN